MTELSRSLLAAAREGLAPDAAIAARVRAKVAASVSATTASATAATKAVAPAAKAGSAATLVKLGAALLAVGVVAAGIVATAPERTPEAPRLTVSATEPDDVRTDIKVAAPNDRPVAPDHPAPRARPAASPHVDSRAPHAEKTVEPASLSREVELIDLAMVSLRKNAPLAAIEAIRVFERETFGNGQMAEEAAAIEIEARCELREDVTTALARFDQKWPSSAQRERIQTACFAR